MSGSELVEGQAGVPAEPLDDVVLRLNELSIEEHDVLPEGGGDDVAAWEYGTDTAGSAGASRASTRMATGEAEPFDDEAAMEERTDTAGSAGASRASTRRAAGRERAAIAPGLAPVCACKLQRAAALVVELAGDVEAELAALVDESPLFCDLMTSIVGLVDALRCPE